MERKAASITLRTTDRRKAKAKDAAERRGITLSDFIDEAVEFYSGLDDYAAECLIRMAETLKLPESLIISNVFLHRLAELRAQEVVYGPIEPDEFIITSRGPQAGEGLYKRLFKSFERQMRQEKLKHLIKMKEDYSLLVNDEELSPERRERYKEILTAAQEGIKVERESLAPPPIETEREARLLTRGFHVGAEDDPYKS